VTYFIHMSILNKASPEDARLAALRNLEVLDTPPEAEFDAIVSGARHLFGCKMAFVSLVDAERQWFKASCGLDVSETARAISFCTQVVAADEMLVIQNASLDERFAANPLVSGPPFIRFYAGVPLRVRGREDETRCRSERCASRMINLTTPPRQAGHASGHGTRDRGPA
jgi:GAF domain-containing protein